MIGSPDENQQFLQEPVALAAKLVYEDTVNLARQMIIPSTIAFPWQKLEQFGILEDIFQSLLSHPIVETSRRLQVFMKDLRRFFQQNHQHLKAESKESLAVIVSNIKLLHPIVEDSSLIGSSEALEYNVDNVIGDFDMHHPTSRSKGSPFISRMSIGFSSSRRIQVESRTASPFRSATLGRRL